jgi:hypothetical protein
MFTTFTSFEFDEVHPVNARALTASIVKATNNATDFFMMISP